MGLMDSRGARGTPAGQLLLAGIASLVLGSGSPARAAGELFALSQLESPGRTVAADFADMDGDGRLDVIAVGVLGLPPEESRFLRVYFQDEDRRFPARPSRVLPLPSGAAAYDVADVLPDPGDELVLLRSNGVTLLKVGRSNQSRRDLPVPGATTLGPAEDERGLERLQLVHRDGADEPRIWVPQLGEMTSLAPDGTVKARLETGGRANYYIPPRPGLIQNESDVQLFYDAARLALGDVDGDGRQDAVTSTRHEVRVFLGRPDGTLPREADRRIPLHRMVLRDHIRGSGGVSADVQDIDGDGRLDVLISHVMGSFADATTRATIHMNRDGAWDLEKADAEFVAESTLASNILMDVDGDGKLELFRMGIAFNVLEVIETLMTKSVDVDMSIHRYDPEKTFAQRPWSHRKIEVGWSFDTFRPEGFIPTIFSDWNADGFNDFLSSGDGKAIEVFLGGANKPYDHRDGYQKLDTSGVLRAGDVDGDHLTDFVLHDPHRLDTPIRVGVNRGLLPGSPPRLDVAHPASPK